MTNVPTMQRPVLWIHGEALGPANPALVAWPAQPAVFVFDTALIESARLSLKRLGFLYECLLELPVTIRRGDVAAEVLAFARRHNADEIVTSAGVDPRFTAIAAAISAELPLRVLPVEPFVELESGDLRRFSRYWRRAEPLVWQRWGGLSSQAQPGG